MAMLKQLYFEISFYIFSSWSASVFQFNKKKEEEEEDEEEGEEGEAGNNLF